MAKFRFTLSIGLVGKQSDVVEIPDEELTGLAEGKRDDVIEQWYSDWKTNFIDGGRSEVEE